MALCLAYVGGPGAAVVKAEGKIVYPSWILGTCCLPPLAVDGFYIRCVRHSRWHITLPLPPAELRAKVPQLLMPKGAYYLAICTFACKARKLLQVL